MKTVAFQRRFRPAYAGFLGLLLCLLAAAAPAADFTILTPVQDQTVHDNQGVVAVAVVPLPGAASYQAYLDGAASGESQPVPRMLLKDVDRGRHSLAVAALDDNGREIRRTSQVEFNMWRASRLFPSRRH